jgi:hypothetical protein
LIVLNNKIGGKLQKTTTNCAKEENQNPKKERKTRTEFSIMELIFFIQCLLGGQTNRYQRIFDKINLWS